MNYSRLFIAVLVAMAVCFLWPEKELSKPQEKAIFHSAAFNEYFASQGFKASDDPKRLNEMFIDEIRQDPQAARIQRMFIGAELTKAYQTFLFGIIPPFSEGDFFCYLKESLAALKQMESFRKGKTSVSNDSYKEGNLPFWQFTLSNPLQTKVIRMGLPIVETSYLESLIFTPVINEEFLSLVRQEQRHLYVNLMKRSGLEGPYSSVLENAEQEEAHLAVVTLDKNSPFYWQEGEYPKETKAFKQLFLKQMQNPNGDFFWTRRLDPIEWNRELALILEEVHRGYFNNAKELDLQDRQDFIELSYLEILDRLVEWLCPDAVNITCKHAIDRGPSLAVLWQWKLGAANENEVAALLLAPPLLMHNRTSHESRLERFLSAAKFFYPKK